MAVARSDGPRRKIGGIKVKKDLSLETEVKGYLPQEY